MFLSLHCSMAFKRGVIPVRWRICTTIPTIWSVSVSTKVRMSKNVRCRTGVSRPMRAFFSSTAPRTASRFTVIICVFLRIISTIRAWSLPTFARWSCCPTRRFVQRSTLRWTCLGPGVWRCSVVGPPCTMRNGISSGSTPSCGALIFLRRRRISFV